MSKKTNRQNSNPGSAGASTSQLNERVTEMEEVLKSGLMEIKSQITSGSYPPEFLDGVTEKLEMLKNSMMQSITALRSELLKIVSKNSDIERSLMVGKQQSLLNNIVISGVPEEPDEDLLQVVLRLINSKVINNHRKLTITNMHINYCQRLGKKDDRRKKPRPISVSFVNRWMRDLTFNSKKQLKGSGVVIAEHLIKSKFDIFNKARDKFGVTSCWTWKGDVYVCKNGERKQIRSDKDIDDFVKKMNN